MPRPDQAHLANAPGPWFVDTRCIRCDSARNWAPGLIGMDAAVRSFISSQPVGEEQEAELWRAAAACPTKSIGNRDQPREPPGVFPYRMTDGVFALGNNALSSFAAHSFLVTRTEGNLMVDSPRFNRALAESVDALGGIGHVLLSHRDDVADAGRWADRYGARVWISEADADAAPYACHRCDRRGRLDCHCPWSRIGSCARAYERPRLVSHRRPSPVHRRHVTLEPPPRGTRRFPKADVLLVVGAGGYDGPSRHAAGGMGVRRARHVAQGG